MSWIAIGVGVAGGVGKMISRGNANKKLKKLGEQDPTYTMNPIAQERYGYAKALLNARMPGAMAAERNIYGNQGNTLAAGQRNATDSSQMLALAGAAQGQTNNAFGNLAMNEAQDYQRRFGNYVGAGQGLIQEGDKVYDDSLRRYGNKMQIQGAISENRANTWGDISNMGFGLADFFGAGGADGMKGMFGNKQQSVSPQMQQQLFNFPRMNETEYNMPPSNGMSRQTPQIPYYLRPRSFNQPPNVGSRWDNYRNP